MPYIEVTAENIAVEHICCAISTAPEQRRCADAKKDWMRERFADDYHFVKLDARGKVFIEYMPAEQAWAPIDADGWVFIDCLWVSGQYKGKGHAGALLQHAVDFARARGSKGLVALTSDKKQPFLSDPAFYRHKGFVTAAAAPPFYQLVALPFAADTPLPAFRQSVGQPPAAQQGLMLYYSHHCPHTGRYVGLLQQTAARLGVPVQTHCFTSAADAQSSPCPFTTYAMYYNGAFVTNEIFSEAKLERFIQENMR